MSYPLHESAFATVHEVQTLRQELADTRKKLQEYADTAISLHGELRTLRDGICRTCKRKFVPANLVSSQADKPAARFSSLVKSSRGPGKSTNPTLSRRRLLNVNVSDHIPSGSGPPTSGIPRSSISNISQTFHSTTLPQSLPILTISSPPPVLRVTMGRNETSASDPVTTATSSNVVIPETVTTFPRWSAQRDMTTNAAIDVMFVRALMHKGKIRSVRFSPDGMYLAVAAVEPTGGGRKGVTFIYNVETGDKICELAPYPSKYSLEARPSIHCVSFSPNGRYLVVGDVVGCVTVWDVPTKRIRNAFRGHRLAVKSVDFSPNGRLVVSTSWDNTVRIWKMRDGSAKVFTQNHIILSVRFSPNGRFVAAGNYDGIMRTWDVRTDQLVRRWTGHKGNVSSVAFMPDGRGLVSGGIDGVVKCWDITSLGTVRAGEPVATQILECKGHATNPVYAVAVSPDAQWIATGLSDKTTVIWDAHSAMRQCTLIGNVDAVSSVDFSPVGSYLALGSHDFNVTLWRYTGTPR